MKLEKRALIALILATAQFAQGQVTSGKALAVYAPRPQYPYEARSKGISGRGVFALNVDPKTGLVRSVTVARSTGNPILDNAAISAFRKWMFKPGTVSEPKVLVPASFGFH